MPGELECLKAWFVGGEVPLWEPLWKPPRAQPRGALSEGDIFEVRTVLGIG